MAAAVAVLPEAPENREAQADPVAQELSESVAAMAVAVELVAAEMAQLQQEVIQEPLAL